MLWTNLLEGETETLNLISLTANNFSLGTIIFNFKIIVKRKHFFYLTWISFSRIKFKFWLITLLVKSRVNEHRHWILHIQISLILILIFPTKFVEKRYFQLKSEQVNITIEFCIFESVSVPNVNLKWYFWYFGRNLPKKGIISGEKQKKWTRPLNFAYSN